MHQFARQIWPLHKMKNEWPEEIRKTIRSNLLKTYFIVFDIDKFYLWF